MVMRLVRDEPDAALSAGIERDATVFADLAFTREPPTGIAPDVLAGRVPVAGKAWKPMSSKSPLQVIEVPEFAPATPPPTDDLSDGAVPPPELPAITDVAGEGGGPGTDVAELSLANLEALLLSTHHPLTPARLNELLGVGSTAAIRRAVFTLNDAYERTGRCFRIEQVAGGYQILTLPEHGDAVRRLHQREADAKLTKAALETLAIVAYKQPILRADVEAIRGVACGETIRSLMEKHLVKIAGRAEEPGRPILYGTTKRFLELFGLNSLKDLPRPEDFKPAAPVGE